MSAPPLGLQGLFYGELYLYLYLTCVLHVLVYTKTIFRYANKKLCIRKKMSKEAP